MYVICKQFNFFSHHGRTFRDSCMYKYLFVTVI